MANKLPLTFTPEAKQDLADIYDYTADYFGIDQAENYLKGLYKVCDLILDNPEIGKIRPHVKHDLRGFTKHRHVIYYRLYPDEIKILRILHSAKDVEDAFDHFIDTLH